MGQDGVVMATIYSLHERILNTNIRVLIIIQLSCSKVIRTLDTQCCVLGFTYAYDSIGLSRRPQPNWGLITQCSLIIMLYTFNILHVLHNLPGVNYTCPHVHYTCTHSQVLFTTSTGYHNCNYTQAFKHK